MCRLDYHFIFQCQPSELSERLSKRTFIYSLSFEWLQNSLKVLLGVQNLIYLHFSLIRFPIVSLKYKHSSLVSEMGVSGDRILRDLWVLKYHYKTIHTRLQRIKDLGVDNLYPWMVRCPEDILNR